MKCLVVKAHPIPDSLCSHLSTLVVQKLLADGHEVVIEDLYLNGFDPVLRPEERASYYTPSYDASKLVDQTKRLQEAEGLVLLFPTWWFGFPAVLKGWFDRVWGPGIAYDHAKDFGPIKPRLDHLKKVLAVTSLGAAWWVDYLVLRRPVKRVLKLALLGACAPGCRLKFLSLYNSEKLTKVRVDHFASKVEKELTRWTV